MRKPLLLLTCLSALLFSIPAWAQVAIDAEFRPRFEIRKGYKSLSPDDTSAAVLTTQRTRLNFKYAGEKLKTRLSVQDVRTWGEENLKSDVPTIGLYEAWAELPLIDSLSLRAGRQELIYGNLRIFSHSNWNHQGQTHDAFLFKYRRNGFSLDFATAFNQVGEPMFGTTNNVLQEKSYKSLNLLWITRKFDGWEASLVGVQDGFQTLDPAADPEKVEHRYTTGFLAKGPLGTLNWFLQAYYQSGHNQTGQEVAAYYLNPELTIPLISRHKLTIGGEFISGQDPDKTSYNSFSTLYGTGHSFNGFMDYFTNMPKDTKNGGLVNGFLKYSFACSPKCLLTADYHHFQNQYSLESNGEKLEKYLGSELDLTMYLTLSSETNLMVGWSMFSGTETMEYLKDGSKDAFSHWAVVMLTVKPTFFRSSK